MATKKIETAIDAENLVHLIHVLNNLEKDIKTLDDQIKKAENSPEGLSEVRIKVFVNGEGGASSPTFKVPSETAFVFVKELEKYKAELTKEIKSFGIKDV